MLTIDRRAEAWRQKLIECWCGHHNPALYPFREALQAALLLEHGLKDGPLPDSRIGLIELATRRVEPPVFGALVTLAVIDYVEDWENGVGSALLPYQLAWARTGRTLSERTGLPAGIQSVRWPS